jgi:hypothetical protein
MSGERDDTLLLMLLEAALAMGILYFVNSWAHGRMKKVKKDGSLFFPLLQATALFTVLLLWFGTRDSETLEAFKLVAGRDALVDVQELGKQLAASFKSIPRSIASTLLSVHDFDKSGTLNGGTAPGRCPISSPRRRTGAAPRSTKPTALPTGFRQSRLERSRATTSAVRIFYG